MIYSLIGEFGTIDGLRRHIPSLRLNLELEMSDQTTPSEFRPIYNAFLAHPSSVNESYFGHMRVALGFFILLWVAALAALIHAIVPALCERTASGIITRLHARMTRRAPGQA